MTHLRIHKLALLTLAAALPLAAQTERPEVVFHVQIVQASPTARTALAGARERQAADFNRDDQMSIHVLTDQTDAPSLVSLPKMTTSPPTRPNH
ncbi:MAG TPA: hypothetical protein VML01_00375 [Bryobacterales bacterium]|nr:hypothetical protein [Bryobacterales bacterium]